MVRQAGGIAALKTKRPGEHFLRGIVGLAAMWLVFNAYETMKLADVGAILFAAPLFLTALAGPVLGETVGPRRWAAVLVGFAGVASAPAFPDVARRASRPDVIAGLRRAGIGSLPELLAHELVPSGVLGSMELSGPLHRLYHPRLNDAAARAFFEQWRGWASRSRLAPMVAVARMLTARLDNILTYLKHRITNAVSEGLNSRIQWVKATARGFRNQQNFVNAIYFHCGGLDLAPGH